MTDALVQPSQTQGFGEGLPATEGANITTSTIAAETAIPDGVLAREELVSAARKAYRAAPADEAPVPVSLSAEVAQTEDAKTGDEAATTDEAPAETVTPPVVEPPKPSRLRALLATKEEAQGTRERAEGQAQAMLREAEQRVQKMLADAEAEGRRRVSSYVDELRMNPIEAARKLGIDPNKLLAQQADDNDPTVVLARRFEAELAKRDEASAARDRELAEIKARDEQRSKYFAHVAQTTAEERFLKASDSVEYSAARALWDPPELLQRAHAVIKAARTNAEKTGESVQVSDDELLLHLNEEARERLQSKRDTLTKLLQEVGGSAASAAPATTTPAKAAAKPGANGKAPAGNGHGTRPLSAAGASERRAPTASPTRELTDREVREQAMSKVVEIFRGA